MPTVETVDLDALLAAKFKEKFAAVEWIPFKILGRTWRITPQPSVVALLGVMSPDDDDAVMSFMLAMVHPEEQADFKRLLTMTAGIDADLFGDILNAMSEAVTGRPTEPPSASSGTSPKTKSRQRSTATSSSPPAEDLDSLD